MFFGVLLLHSKKKTTLTLWLEHRSCLWLYSQPSLSFCINFLLVNAMTPVRQGRGRSQRGVCVRVRSRLTETLFSLSASEMPHYTLVNSLATTLPIWPVSLCLHLLAHTEPLRHQNCICFDSRISSGDVFSRLKAFFLSPLSYF